MIGNRPNRLPDLIVGGLASVPFLAATILLARSLTNGREPALNVEQFADFARTIPSSILISLLVSAAAMLLTLALSPALSRGEKSAAMRILALTAAVFLPPIILVLVGALLLNAAPILQPIVPALLQTLTVYPLSAIVAVLLFEPQLIDVARVELCSHGQSGASILTAIRTPSRTCDRPARDRSCRSIPGLSRKLTAQRRTSG